MASKALRLPSNAPGDFFVDASCIDCAACRWIAPRTFDEAEGASRVHTQPADASARLRAQMALLACPTGSIGAETRQDLSEAREAFPAQVDGPVYHCGYHAESSFGAASWLVVRPDGNVLVDSPRFNRGLVTRLEALGGVRWMFLTHRDDVAEHARLAAHFGAERVMHAADLSKGTRDVERPVEGQAPVQLADGLLVVPTPGHTRGSACLLVENRYLFTGDHLAFDPEGPGVEAWPEVCWYDWTRQTESVEKLAEFRFEWVLPGHGWPGRLEPEAMREAVLECARRMRS